MAWYMILTLIITVFALVLLHPANAKVISFQEQYQDYLGNWHTYTSANVNSYPFYSWVDSGSNYSVIRIDDSITLPKTNTIYNFNPKKISFTINLTPAQLNSRSTQDGSNWYIVIPKPTTQLRFGWDDLKPTVTNNTGYVIPDNNFWYSKINESIRFYYNQTARNTGAMSSYLTFSFNSFTINNATTSGFTTSNISLNGSKWTDDGELALNLRNDSALNMTELVGYWSADETHGTIWHNVNNESGLINTTNVGTWNGNTTLNYTTGVIGGAGNFDGIDDFIDIQNDTSINLINPFTISVWVNQSGYQSNIADIIYKRVGNTGYRISSDTTGKIRGTVGDGASLSTIFSDFPITNNTWNLIVLTGDSSNTISMYINATIQTTTFVKTLTVANNDLFFGTGGAFFNGSIDEVHIWRRALNASEVAVLYNTSLRTQAMPTIYQQNASIGHVINRTRIVNRCIGGINAICAVRS